MPSIDEIEAVDPTIARKLRKAGVRTTEGLLRRAGTRAGRVELGEATGFAPDQLLNWVNCADLMRIRGIGSEYADLLARAGVDTIKALRRRNAKSLTARMVEVNDHARRVRRLPTESMVAAWIEHSKGMEPTVKP